MTRALRPLPFSASLLLLLLVATAHPSWAQDREGEGCEAIERAYPGNERGAGVEGVNVPRFSELLEGGCPSVPTPTLVGTLQGQAVQDAVNLTTFDYLAAAVQFDKQKVKLVVAPFVASPTSPLSGLRLSLSNGDDDYSLGAAWSLTNASPRGARARAIFEDAFESQPSITPDERASGLARALDDRFYSAYRAAHDRLLTGGYTVTLGATAFVFEDLFITEVDRDGDGAVDNEHDWKGVNVNLAGSYSLSPRLGVSASYGPTFKRGGPSGADSLATYHNASATISWVAYVPSGRYWERPEFVTDFFVPTVSLGATVEQEWCLGEAQCEEGVVRQFGVTPFVSVSVVPKQSFRLGATYRRFEVVDEDEDGGSSVLPLLQYVLSFGAN